MVEQTPGGMGMKRLIMIAAVGLVLGSCGEVKPPKRGSVEAGGRISQSGSVKLSASINCILPGEEVDFDLAIINQEVGILTMVGTPLIDIAVRNANNEILWSQASSYPRDIDPILQPGEQRHYHWRWRATDFDGPIVAVVLMKVQSPDTTIADASELVLPLGVNRINWTIGGVSSDIACSELR